MKNLKFKTALLAGTISMLLTQPLSASTFELEEDQKRITYGADFRYRIIHEHDRKISDADANGERTWQRFRLRAWTSLQMTRTAEFNLRIVAEPRYYTYPGKQEDNGWVRDEFLFDNVNLTLRDPFDIPVTAVIGRQQIQIADNWLVGEGTPLDGTRTAYFDAIRTTWNIEDWRTSIDVMYIDNRKDSSSVIAPINDYDFDMIEQDERGGIVWLSHEAAERNFIDTYFIYKLDHNPTYVGATKVGVAGETYTVGLRGHGQATDNLSYNAEIAPQFGHKNGSSLSAFAVNTWAEQRVSEAKNATIRLGYEYLSGDSNIDQHFDKLWGREGIWSDLYTGGVDGFDGRALDSSNLHRPHILAAINLLESVRAKGEYSLLFADKEVDLGGDTSKVDNGSMFRGHHVKASVEHKLNKHLKHYVTFQCMIPGDYYSDARQDTATWFRYGFELKF